MSQKWQWVISLTLAGLVSYFTAQIKNERDIAVIDTREQTRFSEIQRRFDGFERGQAELAQSQQRIEMLFERVVRDWAQGVNRRTGEPLPLDAARQKDGR